MLSRPKIPQTITISSGANEKDLPAAAEYATSVCLLFAQLGARGVSIFFSSGDNDVGARDRKDSSGRVQFIPRFPAPCPWITNIGGMTSSLPEVAAGHSGGGFSNYFPRPDYQNGGVTPFSSVLATSITAHTSSFSAVTRPNLFLDSNFVICPALPRGIPDIAAQALRYIIAVNTNPIHVSGASCATLGSPRLGSSIPGCKAADSRASVVSNPSCGTDGFPAIGGWDPAQATKDEHFRKDYYY
ncbi:peptidase S8/S53 domain-containing protein [Lactarius psammicola]|nr:peptidase S8/S53 domain-containing protein [Lactarius psammicola]